MPESHQSVWRDIIAWESWPEPTRWSRPNRTPRRPNYRTRSSSSVANLRTYRQDGIATTADTDFADVPWNLNVSYVTTRKQQQKSNRRRRSRDVKVSRPLWPCDIETETTFWSRFRSHSSQSWSHLGLVEVWSRSHVSWSRGL